MSPDPDTEADSLSSDTPKLYSATSAALAPYSAVPYSDTLVSFKVNGVLK